MLPIPGGFNFELTEFTNTPSRTLNQQAEISDPGAPHMKFLVRDIEPVMAGVKKMGLPIITSSKAPVAVKTQFGDGKAIFFRDPDGYIVEAVQIPAPADAPAGNNIGSIMGLTVRDMDADMKFWATRMGLEVSGDKKFAKDAARQDLYGIGKGGEYRTMSATFPQSKARIEFIEFKGMPRTGEVERHHRERVHQGPERPQPGAGRHARRCARRAVPGHAAWPRRAAGGPCRTGAVDEVAPLRVVRRT
jgi:catechol 2,3-dioxygenase-like lactoylglutathione lyase family enzyme